MDPNIPVKIKVDEQSEEKCLVLTPQSEETDPMRPREKVQTFDVLINRKIITM